MIERKSTCEGMDRKPYHRERYTAKAIAIPFKHASGNVGLLVFITVMSPGTYECQCKPFVVSHQSFTCNCSNNVLLTHIVKTTMFCMSSNQVVSCVCVSSNMLDTLATTMCWCHSKKATWTFRLWAVVWTRLETSRYRECYI